MRFVLFIFIGIAFIVELFSVSWCVMSESMYGRRKAIKQKLLCSLMFLAVLLLSAALKNAFCDLYVILLIADLVLCLVGDVLINTDKKFSFISAMLLFASGKACEAVAFSTLLKDYFGVAVINTKDIVALAAIVAVLLAAVLINRHIKPSGMKVAVFLYGAVVAFTLVKALHLGVLSQQSGVGDLQSFSCTVILGALGFTVSDFVLLMMFDEKKNTQKYSLMNGYFYFFGQMLIASSVLFFKGGALL